MNVQPRFQEIKNGWAAVGDGWAVHASTKEDALRQYEEAERRHREIDKRPLPTAPALGEDEGN